MRIAVACGGVRRSSRQGRGTALRVQEARASGPGAAQAGARASGAVPGAHARALSQTASEVRGARAQRAAVLWRSVARVHARPVPALPARVLCRLQLWCKNGLSVVLGPAHGRGQRALDGSSPSRRTRSAICAVRSLRAEAAAGEPVRGAQRGDSDRDAGVARLVSKARQGAGTAGGGDRGGFVRATIWDPSDTLPPPHFQPVVFARALPP